MRSSEPSSITTIRRRATGSASRRSTLSAIVTSSFSAGTRKTQVKASAPSGGGCGRVDDRAVAADEEQQRPAGTSPTTTTRQTVKRDLPRPRGRPSKGQVGVPSTALSPSTRLGRLLRRPPPPGAASPQGRLELLQRRLAGADEAGAPSAIDGAAVAGAERGRRLAAEQDVLEGGDDPLGGVAVAVGVRRPRPSPRRRRRSSSRRERLGRRSSPGSVPTRRSVPAARPSVRSVVSRVTSTGLPSDGASSWMPPESVITRWARPSRRAEGGVAERLGEQHVVEPGQPLGQHLAHPRVRDGPGARSGRRHGRRRQAGDALGDPAQAVAPVLAPVGGDDDDPASRCRAAPAARGWRT